MQLIINKWNNYKGAAIVWTRMNYRVYCVWLLWISCADLYDAVSVPKPDRGRCRECAGDGRTVCWLFYCTVTDSFLDLFPDPGGNTDFSLSEGKNAISEVVFRIFNPGRYADRKAVQYLWQSCFCQCDWLRMDFSRKYMDVCGAAAYDEKGTAYCGTFWKCW